MISFKGLWPMFQPEKPFRGFNHQDMMKMLREGWSYPVLIALFLIFLANASIWITTYEISPTGRHEPVPPVQALIHVVVFLGSLGGLGYIFSFSPERSRLKKWVNEAFKKLGV